MALMETLTQAAQDRPLVVFIVVNLLLLVVFRSTSSSGQKYPNNLPWIGKDNTKLFAATRATFSSINNVNKWLSEGYQKVMRDSIMDTHPGFDADGFAR